MLGRVQKDFPATGEVLAPYAIGPYVAGAMRGSHQMPLMPVPLNSGISYFDGPPVVSCAAFAMHRGKLTESVDAFAHPFWDTIRDAVSNKAIGMRRQGFFGAAMLPMSELEYTGIVEMLSRLDERFTVRRNGPPSSPLSTSTPGPIARHARSITARRGWATAMAVSAVLIATG